MLWIDRAPGYLEKMGSPNRDSPGKNGPFLGKLEGRECWAVFGLVQRDRLREPHNFSQNLGTLEAFFPFALMPAASGFPHGTRPGPLICVRR